jgi:hypothetical protein
VNIKNVFPNLKETKRNSDGVARDPTINKNKKTRNRATAREEKLFGFNLKKIRTRTNEKKLQKHNSQHTNQT